MVQPMPAHPATLASPLLLAQCQTRHGRASGPGGQHRNKVETSVELIHLPTGVSARATERRSQVANHRVALQRLRLNLALNVRTKPSEKPSSLWCRRRRGNTIRISREHADFPALLAEVLDQFAECGYEPTPAAASLGVTMSQLVRLLRAEPRAMVQINAQRQQHGRHILR